MSNRKQHNQEAGYVCERVNPLLPGRKIVVYIAEAQGIEADGRKYAVVCDAHKTIGPSSNVSDARVLMKNPENFCDDCRYLIPVMYVFNRPGKK